MNFWVLWGTFGYFDVLLGTSTTKLAFALPDFQKLIEYIFLARFYDGLTYDKIGLCPSWFSKIDGVLFFWLDSIMVWPTTKLAFSFQFFKNWWSTFFLARFFDGLTYDKIGLCPSRFSKIDGVHFLARFYDGLTYDKIGLRPSWFSKIDGVHFFG